jgi:SOS-response transcriptional repressor LexA
MGNFANRLKNAMDSAGMKPTDLHEKTGISKSSISEYLSGRYVPKQHNIYKMAVALHVAPSLLMYGEQDKAFDILVPGTLTIPRKKHLSVKKTLYKTLSGVDDVEGLQIHRLKDIKDVTTKQRKIPLLGKVAAGVPIYADDHVEGHEFIDSKYRNDGFEYFALRVSGHSMEPTIQDGDIVVVRQQDTVDSGQIAIVLVDGEDATAKEVRIDKAGITLVGHNISVYTPKFYTNEQIADLPVKIIGLVIEVRHKLI